MKRQGTRAQDRNPARRKAVGGQRNGLQRHCSRRRPGPNAWIEPKFAR